MRVIGLTGGIGSGKTTVAGLLAERGAVVIDADRIARQLVEPGSPVLDELASAFGADIVQPEGDLDRALLASRAFSSSEATQRLNTIMHPRIRREVNDRMSRLPAGTPLVVLDLPLLIEGQLDDGSHPRPAIDLVVVVDAPEDVQVARATARGLSAADVRQRMLAQASRADRRAAADEIIDNSGSIESTREQVDGLWQRLVTQ